MKTITIIFLVLLAGCTNQNAQKNNSGFKLNDSVKQIIVPDTIKTISGFYLGMTEKEIRDYVKSNPNKFYRDKKYLLAMLLTKINNMPYMIDFNMYKGKLNEISMWGVKGWNEIDDNKLKEHYKKIYTLIKESNDYKRISDEYLKQYQVEWPFSYGSKPIRMAEFKFGEGLFDENITLYLDRDQDNYFYFLMIAYKSESIKDYESTLSKTLYFDEL